MCNPGQSRDELPPPASAAGAVAMARTALAYLADADLASLPIETQAECLRGLELLESLQTVARAGAAAAFDASGGFEADGQGTVKAWLRWQTRVTRHAAGETVGWARRLAAHPAVRDALAAAEISASWARQVCTWTDKLPEAKRAEADAILLAAAAGGADLADLAGLAAEMVRRCAAPDGDDRFTDRWLRLDLTFRGAGRLEGDLTPECAAALRAVLESLGKKAGPEDERTQRQRDHDALEEACRRLAGSGFLPDRAGQPTQVQLHMSLDQLRGQDGAEAAWAAGRAANRDRDGEPGWLRDLAAAEGYACDAQITPIVSGHVDRVALALMVRRFLAATSTARADGCRLEGCRTGHHTDAASPDGRDPGGCRAGDGRPARSPLPVSFGELMDMFLRQAVEVLSGPTGLAAQLRMNLPGAQPVSLPLDVGTAASTIPAHLRRVVISRDRHCAFPGCHQRPAACQVHHIVPRADGGVTALPNLVLLCPFHHLVAIHRWGWAITLHADGTTTAISPDRQKIHHSHGPPTPMVA